MKKSITVVDTRDANEAQELAEQTLAAIKNSEMEPTPRRYSLWYSFIAKDDMEMVAEMEQLMKGKKKLTDDAADYLYTKYLDSDNANQKVLTHQTQETMNELLDMVNGFSTKSRAYNKKLGKQAKILSGQVESNQSLKNLLGEVVDQINEIHNSGESFNAQLIASQQEVQKLKADLNKVADEARKDFLTGINNRRAFDELMIQMTKESKDEQLDLCLLMLDIDHFKSFNDTYGHQIGDEVLKVVAGALKRTVRGQDVVARFGGEEFAILLRDTPTSGAHIVAENIRKHIAGNRIKKRNSNEELRRITVSIGVSRYRYSEQDLIPEFIERADSALYKAKENGRNRVSLEL